jgi:hypothetical protein
MQLRGEQEGLASRQADLVRALAGDGAVPAGFDFDRLQACRGALAQKRATAVARAWPALARELGDRFTSLFAQYAEQGGLPARGGPLADGLWFVRFLAGNVSPGPGTRLERLAVELRFRSVAEGLVARRGLSFAGAVVADPRRVCLAVRWAGWGERWFSLPLGWR